MNTYTPTLRDLLNALRIDLKLSTNDEIKEALQLIIDVQNMGNGEIDCIRVSFIDGVIDDGDIPCKPSRDKLVANGYMSRIVFHCSDRYNACTLKGASAYKLIKILYPQKLGATGRAE